MLVTLANTVVTTSIISDIETFDNNDGTYKVDYKILLADIHTLAVTINGDSTNTKTSSIDV